MRRCNSYAFKLGLTFAALLLATTSLSLALVYSRTKPLLLTQMGSRLEDIGRTARFLFGPQEFEAIERVRAEILKAQKEIGVIVPPAAPGEYKKTLPDPVAAEIIKLPDYQYLVALLRKIKSGSRRSEGPTPEGATESATLAFVSLFMPESIDPEHQVAQFIADTDYDHATVPAPPGNLLFNNSPALERAFKGSVGSDPDFRFEQGMHILTAAIPLFDESGVQRAVLSLYYDAGSEVNNVTQLFKLCIGIVLLAVTSAVVCSMMLTWFLTRDIRSLRCGAERVRERDFSVTINLTRSDELGMFARSFNDMIEEIRRYATGLEATNRAYAKFVPKQILQFLGQDSITSIKLGDQVQRQMTVLFADIRSFTTISESMSPRDNFDFINEYLRTIGPIIREHNGFIDKYIGDAIMALFPERPEDALKAAIQMQSTLRVFNEAGKDVGRPAVEIGIGIHRGNLMLGTVGEEERMEGTVISDAVNLTSRIEGLTKQFGAEIIVSEAALEAIQGEKRFIYRYLGETKVKGKRRSVKIYELIDGSETDSARRKAITIKAFERGVRAFEKQDYPRARRSFGEVLKIHRKDMAARYYAVRCRLDKQKALPESTAGKNLITVDEERFKKKGA